MRCPICKRKLVGDIMFHLTKIHTMSDKDMIRLLLQMVMELREKLARLGVDPNE